MKNSLLIPVFMLVVGGIVGATGVWFLKPSDTEKTRTTTSGIDVSTNDIVCNGRIDTLKPIIPLYPKVPGTVKSVQADESMAVSKGHLLMELDPKPYLLKLAAAKANADLAKAQLDEAESEKMKFTYTVDQAKEGVKLAELELELSNKELRQAKEKKAEQAANPNAASSILITDEFIDQIEFKAKAAKTKVDYANLTLGSLQKTDLESKLNQAKAARDMANAQVAEAEEAINDCKVLAPADGGVLRVNIAPGAQVAPGSPLVPMLFATTGPMIVRAEMDQEYVSRVEVGAKATLRDESIPNSPTWEGQVLSISRWIARPRSVLFDPLEINDVRTCEVVVEVKRNSATGNLLLGHRVRVRIKPNQGS